jgi:hypothetical protein
MGKTQYCVRLDTAPLGLQLETVNGNHYVGALVAGCAAAAAGTITVGDQLLQVNGTPISKLDHTELIAAIVVANKAVVADGVQLTLDRTAQGIPKQHTPVRSPPLSLAVRTFSPSSSTLSLPLLCNGRGAVLVLRHDFAAPRAIEFHTSFAPLQDMMVGDRPMLKQPT